MLTGYCKILVGPKGILQKGDLQVIPGKKEANQQELFKTAGVTFCEKLVVIVVELRIKSNDNCLTRIFLILFSYSRTFTCRLKINFILV